MHFPTLVDPSLLEQHLNDSNILVIDLSSEENYLAGHIPGAIHVSPAKLLAGTGTVPNKCPSVEQIQTLCDEIGLTPESQVIAYDDQMGPLAGRFLWTLNIAGHTQCSVLNGQLNAWKQQGLPLETTANTATASNYPLQLNQSLIADVAFIKSQLDTPSFVVWDARSADEYSGKKIVNAKKGGHIPGAKHLEWTECLVNPPEDVRVKSNDELLTLLNDRGITADKTIVTHCQTHRRSGLTYFIAKHLGFENIRCYDGSWFEWGNREDTPVER